MDIVQNARARRYRNWMFFPPMRNDLGGMNVSNAVACGQKGSGVNFQHKIAVAPEAQGVEVRVVWGDKFEVHVNSGGAYQLGHQVRGYFDVADEAPHVLRRLETIDQQYSFALWR
jgi:hypothetical protein